MDLVVTTVIYMLIAIGLVMIVAAAVLTVLWLYLLYQFLKDY